MKTSFYFIKRFLVVLLLIQTTNTSANKNETIHSGAIDSSDQLVAAVLQANPRLEVAQATWQASVARIKQQASLEDPQFQYSFAPLTIDSKTSGFGQRFELSQHIPFPGKLDARGKTAEYQAETLQQNIATLQLLLATTAKSLFADWYFIHQAIDINKINQNLLQEFREIAMSRYSTGRASKQDVLRADVELALLKHQAIALRREKKTIIAHLNTLLNRSVDTVLPEPQKLTEISELPDLKELQIKAIHSRPELKAIAARINMHKTQIELAELAYYPDLKLSAGYNSLWDNVDKRFNIGVGINIPLNQSKRQAAEQVAKANSQQAHWQKIDLEAKIKEELAIAYAFAEESLHVLQLYRQQLSLLADENLAAAKADYQAGKGDFLTLISSEKNRMQTRIQTEQAFADVHSRFAELGRVVGTLEPLATVSKTGGRAP